MSKTLKISLLTLLAFIALIGVGAWYATSFINPAQLAKVLSSSVKEMTGRELKITGPVSLNLFPSINVKAEQVSLSNASWASSSDMLTLKQIELDICFLPLLRGRVEISKISLFGARVNLQTNRGGEGNWNLTAPSLVANVPVNLAPTQAAVDQASGASADSPFVSLSTVDVIDATIQYQESDHAPKVIQLPKLSLSSSDGKATILVDLQYANYVLNLKGKTNSLRNAYFNWDQSPVNMDLDLVLTLNGKSLAIKGVIDKKPQTLPQLNLDLSSKSFYLQPLAGSVAAASVGGKGIAVSAPKHQSKYFFSDDDLPFHLIPMADGVININIAELGMPNQAPLTNFKTTLQFKKDQIEANDLSFNVGKGSARAQLSISGFSGASPRLSFEGMAKDFTLEQITSSANGGAKVSGGATQMAWNLKGSGMSPHQIVSHANGAIQISVGSGKLDSKFIDQGGDFIVTVLDAINPLYKKTNQTVLECAVAYLPLNNGMININNSVGVVTDRLNITLSGSVNLNSEALDININPSEKSGLTTGVDLGGLVKIQGTLKNPQAGVNKTGVVTSAVSIGLGFLTGGISIAAENAKSLATKSQPCKAALHPWSEIYPASN